MLRKQKTKNTSVSTKLSGIGYQAQSMQSTAAMAGAMSTASKVSHFKFIETYSYVMNVRMNG